MRHVCNSIGIRDLERVHLFRAPEHVQATVGLAPGPLHFTMSSVANQDDLSALTCESPHPQMDLADQWARGVHDAQVARLGVALDLTAHAVRTEDDDRARRDIVQRLGQDRAALLEPIDDVRVVHDLVQHVDRGTEHVQRPLYDLYRANDTGAETARL